MFLIILVRLIIPFVLYFRVLHPLVLWAQRKDIIFLTIRLEDTTNPEIKLDEEKMYFRYLKSVLFICIDLLKSTLCEV